MCLCGFYFIFIFCEKLFVESRFNSSLSRQPLFHYIFGFSILFYFVSIYSGIHFYLTIFPFFLFFVPFICLFVRGHPRSLAEFEEDIQFSQQ